MFDRPRLLAIALAILLPLAGCIGKDSGGAPDVVPAADVNDTPQNNATLPDGRGESAGITETNKTEEGVGGVDHTHDYWRGEDRVILFDEDVTLFCPPCMPDGEGTDPKAVAYVKLGKVPDGSVDALVYEGAEKVEVLIGAPILDADGTRSVAVPHPSPPGMYLQYRSASDAAWTMPLQVAYDTPIVLDVTPQMTDMPHSTHSLWVFRLTTDRAESQVSAPMTVTAVKGREVVDWPGHPDFYAERDSRIVMQQHVTTHMSGIESFALYDSGGSWATPERLISWRTKEIHVIVNITGAKNVYNAEPTGYFLEVHNATIIGPEVTFGSRHSEIDGKNDLLSYQFAILVDEVGMDGPYQPASRWGFRAMATFADFDLPTGGGIGLCPGCFPYDIEYDITVIAMNYESGRGEVMEE